MCCRLDLRIPSYSGKSNGLHFLWMFLYDLPFYHPPYFQWRCEHGFQMLFTTSCRTRNFITFEKRKILRVLLCGFRHISTSGLGVGASRSSFIAVLGQPLQVTVHLCYGTIYPVCPVCNVGVLWPNGWMDLDVTFYGGRPRPRRDCVRWGPISPQRGAQLPTFRLMFIVAKGSPISATAELL